MKVKNSDRFSIFLNYFLSVLIDTTKTVLQFLSYQIYNFMKEKYGFQLTMSQ